MSRTLTRGFVVAFLALLGCQGEPARVPKAQLPENDSQIANAPTPVPQAPQLPAHATPPKGAHFIPPVVAQPPPEIRIPPLRQLVWDMGVIPPGMKKEYRFAIHNDSNVTWNVKNVTPDCKCALGEFTSKTVKPGETTHLQVGFRADVREGNFVGGIGLDFREVEAPRFMLFLKAEVRKPFSILPAAVDLGRVGPAEHVTRSLELRNYTDADLLPPKVEAPPWMRVELQAVEKKTEDNRARQTWEVQVHADLAQLKSAADPGMLVVRTGAPMELFTIPITLKIKAPLEVSPGEVVFENYRSGEAVERTFLLETYPDLSSVTEKDLLITHDLGDELTVEVTKKLGPNRFQLVARYRPQSAYATVEGELTVSVRDRDVPPARIKVRGKRG